MVGTWLSLDSEMVTGDWLLQVTAVTSDYQRQLQQLHAAQQSTSQMTELHSKLSMQEVRATIPPHTHTQTVLMAAVGFLPRHVPNDNLC